MSSAPFFIQILFFSAQFRNGTYFCHILFIRFFRLFLLSFRCFFFPFGSILNVLFGLNRNGLRNTLADNLDVSVIMFQRKFVFFTIYIVFACNIGLMRF